MSRPSARRQGVTLAEMLVVVAVLAIAATIVIPKADVVSPAAVDGATRQVAAAMRFARREAIRTGAYHVVKLDTTVQTLRVYRLTTSGAVAEDTANPVLNPLDHRPYTINLSNDQAMSPAAAIVSAAFSYQGGATTTYASFGPDGAPADINGSLSKNVLPLQGNGLVTLGRGGVVQTVTVAPVTGRVTF